MFNHHPLGPRCKLDPSKVWGIYSWRSWYQGKISHFSRRKKNCMQGNGISCKVQHYKIWRRVLKDRYPDAIVGKQRKNSISSLKQNIESGVKVIIWNIDNPIYTLFFSGYPVHLEVQTQRCGWQLLQGEPRYLWHGPASSDGYKLLSLGYG